VNKRPGKVIVTTEVGYCSFCGRPRNLRREDHQLGALVRSIVTCETCHRTLSSTIGVASAEPEKPVEAPAPAPVAATPQPAPAAVAAKPRPAPAKRPAARAATKPAAKKPSVKAKPAAKPSKPAAKRTTTTKSASKKKK
jgi:hypothetical protein